jgi:hypothetical protein
VRASFFLSKFIVTGVALVDLAFGSFAFAASPDATDAVDNATTKAPLSDIVAPKALATEVEAPVEPDHSVEVLLELVVNEQGTVDDSTLLFGQEPFGSAALKAAAHFRFSPARFRGKNVAAKIRFLVRFEPKQLLPLEPKAQKANPHTSSQKSAKELTPPSPQPAMEVTVVGIRPSYTTGVITRAEAREVPGTFGDPLRAIETSPGVTPVFSGVPYFFVRGAPPGNVGFFLDGVKVPLLYHAVLGPSVVHPALIDHVDMYRGAPSAQFGRYAGAIINAETRPGLSRLGGEANVRIFDAGGLIETPFANGKGHALVGGRYSYTALAASLLTNADLQYWDYQSRADYAVGSHGRVGIFAFGAYDRFSAQDGKINRGAGTQFHRADIRYDYATERTNSRFAVTAGYDRSDSTSGALSNRVLAARSTTQHHFSRHVSLDFGGDISLDAYRLRIDETTAEADDILALFPARTDIVGGVYTELNLKPSDWVTLSPGVRADGYRINDRTASSVDPRFSTTFRPNQTIYTNYTIGLMHQAPNFVPQLPAAQVGTLQGGLQRSISASTTIGVKLPYGFSTAVTGYRVAFFDLLDPIGRDSSFALDASSLNHRERGSATGLELEIRRAMTKRIGGFVSCTLSRTERSTKNRESLSAYDRPIILQGAVGIDLGRNYRAGARIAYYSGVPSLEIGYGREPYYSGAHRTKGFFRADLRIEKRWPIKGRGYWALVAEMLNATMSTEYTSRKCSASHCDTEPSGPIAIPSVGVELYSY